MKNIFVIILMLLITGNSVAQHHILIKLWETDTIIAVPESVLPVNDKLFISLIDGGGWEADGKGGIGILSKDGKNYNAQFISGMNAPKGMAIYHNEIYVADIDELVVVNVKDGKIVKKIQIPGALALNDVTADDQGIVYVSDSKAGIIWKVSKGEPSVYLDAISRPNGVKIVNGELVYAAGSSLKKADKNKRITTLGSVSKDIDGIEPVGNGDFLLSSWPGYLFYLYADGHYDVLLETHEQKINTADIGYDSEQRILYVPTFNGKTVAAYQLK